jgi:hypothetical protein
VVDKSMGFGGAGGAQLFAPCNATTDLIITGGCYVVGSLNDVVNSSYPVSPAENFGLWAWSCNISGPETATLHARAVCYPHP